MRRWSHEIINKWLILADKNYVKGVYSTIRKEIFMRIVLSTKLLSVILVSALLSPLLRAHANEPVNNQTVTSQKHG
jgi:hypothetical protein